MDPNQIAPIVVPVVPRTQAGTVQRLLSSVGMTIGFILVGAQQNLPQITAAFPQFKWLSWAILLAGSVWVSWQKAVETGTVVAVPVQKVDGA